MWKALSRPSARSHLQGQWADRLASDLEIKEKQTSLFVLCNPTDRNLYLCLGWMPRCRSLSHINALRQNMYSVSAFLLSPV